MTTQLADALVTVNNVPVAIMPNSLVFTEGLGEQVIRAASAGGGQVEQIYSNNIESNFSMVNFAIPATVDNIAAARQWKTNKNQNVVTVQGQTPEGTVTRTFTQAAILNDYEVALGSETDIPVEFKANPAV